MANKGINVYSDIGKLKTVLVHRPGDEVINLAPDFLERLLFDDTPDLKVAQKEHDKFTSILREKGVEVLYIEKLCAEVLDGQPNLKDKFVDQYLKECGADSSYIPKLREYLMKFNNQDLVNKMIAGVTKHELGVEMKDGYPLAIDPLPNILFQRDPFASVGTGVTIHRMFSVTRRRETLFSDLVLREHPRFKNEVQYLYSRDEEDIIEGGDVLVLNKDTILVGATQRTSLKAIEKLAGRLFKENSKFKRVVAIELKTKNRAFMHLDTVFTNIDCDKFIVHPLIFKSANEFKMVEFSKDGGKKEIDKPITDYLNDVVGKKITFIMCGGDDPIHQAREQWNDGTNVLTIAPGEVIAYDRNHITVELLKKLGVKVNIMPSSELSRGRGGPRCMSMAIWREDI